MLSAVGLFKMSTIHTGSERILFVDDELPITKMGTKILKRLGYTVTASNDPLSALEIFKKSPDAFDLVISDMTMPKMTGDKLAEKLIEIRPDIPTIIISGYSKKVADELLYKNCVKAFITKPLNMGLFTKTMRNLLDGADTRT